MLYRFLIMGLMSLMPALSQGAMIITCADQSFAYQSLSVNREGGQIQVVMRAAAFGGYNGRSVLIQTVPGGTLVFSFEESECTQLGTLLDCYQNKGVSLVKYSTSYTADPTFPPGQPAPQEFKAKYLRRRIENRTAGVESVHGDSTKKFTFAILEFKERKHGRRVGAFVTQMDFGGTWACEAARD